MDSTAAVAQHKVGDLIGAGHLQEAIFTVQWGKADPKTIPDLSINGQVSFNVGLRLEDIQVLPIRLATEVAKDGFGHVETIPVAGMPGPLLRYTKEKGTWPIIQVVPGVFSVHQMGKAYVWENFRDIILKSTNSFRTAYPGNFGEVTNLLAFELRYRNAILIGEKSPFDVLTAETRVGISIPTALTADPNIESAIKGSRFNFDRITQVPKGIRTLDFIQSMFDVDQKRGILFDVSVKSSVRQDISFETQATWLEEAHECIRSAYRTVTGYEPAK